MKETKDSDESVTLCLWMQAEHKKRCTVLFVMLSDFLMLCSNAKPHYLAPALSLCQIWLCYERGTIQSSPHLPNETAPSLLLVIFLDLSLSSTSIHNCLSEFCVKHCFKAL